MRRRFVVGERASGEMFLAGVRASGGPLLGAIPERYKAVHVFWELLGDEEKPFQGLQFGTLCALLYEDVFPEVHVLLAAVYEHREGEGYPLRWRAKIEQLPRWLQLAAVVDPKTLDWRFPDPKVLPAGRRPVWAAVALPDPKVKAAAQEAGLGE